MSMTRELARPTAAPALPIPTVTPGGVADYSGAGSPVMLVVKLAAYGVAEPAIPRGEWERSDWECLARRAGA